MESQSILKRPDILAGLPLIPTRIITGDEKCQIYLGQLPQKN